MTLDEAVTDGDGARRRAEQAMDQVRTRFGQDAMRPGALVPKVQQDALARSTRPSTTAHGDGDLS
jgi:hypothetical protein